jgi:hypothetical protein
MLKVSLNPEKESRESGVESIKNNPGIQHQHKKITEC